MKSRWRDKRIGIDLDRPSQLRLLETVVNARNMFPKSKIEVKATAHGFHIRIFKKHSVKANLEVRRMLGDDPMRIAIDEKRLTWGLSSWIDTLFTFKRQNGVISMEEDCNIWALPFASKLPCRKVKA